MVGVHECTRASALPPPLRKAMLPGQSTHSEGDTSWPRWETGAWSSQVSHLSTGGTSKVQSHAGTFTLQNLLLSVSVGTTVSPRWVPKMGADGSSAPLGGRRGSVYGTARDRWCEFLAWVSSAVVITGGPHPPTPAPSRPAMVSAPALHPWGPDLITVGRKLWLSWMQPGTLCSRWSFSSFSLLTSWTANIILWYLR